MKELGKEKLRKAMEFKFGQMELNIKEIGCMDKPMEKVNFFMLMAIYMMDIGKMAKLTDMESSHNIQVPSMKGIGKMT
jgi:hypothetical protein